MRDFVLGKPIPDECKGVVGAATTSEHLSKDTVVAKPIKAVRSSTQTLTTTTTAPVTAARNPYARARTSVKQCSTGIPQRDDTVAAPPPSSDTCSGLSSLHNPALLTHRAFPAHHTAVIEPPLAKPPSAAANKTLAKADNTIFVPGPVPLAPHDIVKEWIYPADEKYPKRQYQIEISESAMFNNTLVSLPTGLGKTLIAAVVLYNFYRSFPTGKVIFLAPTLPLVNQQVRACYDVMGIPTQDTAVLTGKTSADRRTWVWQERRVFFCTPQTVQKDLEGGRCEAKQVVCIVLDEAHKAT
jgi:hypothetical protein